MLKSHLSKTKCPGLYTEKLPASTNQGFTVETPVAHESQGQFQNGRLGSARRLADFTPRVVQKFVGFGE